MQKQSNVYEQLMAKALLFVSFRPRSEKEIREYLGKKLHRSHTTAPIVLEKVLARLRELGYADDVKFAAWWVGQRTGRKPKGKKLIEHELRRKGITQEVDIDEKELARRAIEKKKGKLDTPKLVAYLQRRGFDWETISGIIGEANEKD